jgi:hypothetical protein
LFPPLHGNTFGVEVALLAIAVGVGIVVYVGSVLAFWWLCGKPSDSSESHVMTFVSDTVRARRAAAAAPTTDQSD